MNDQEVNKTPKIEHHETEIREDRYRFVGKWKKKGANLTLYAYNKETNTLKEAEIKSEKYAKYNPKTEEYEEATRRSIVREKGWFYFWSLNEKNAWDKIMSTLGLK